MFNRDRMAIICVHCERQGQPILHVAHTQDDGIFQFLCGEDGHEIDDGWPIHLYHVLEMDPSLEELVQIKEDFYADRERVGAAWMIQYENIDEE